MKEQWVPVYVPERLVPRVLQEVVVLLAEDASSPNGDADSGSSHGEWSPELVQRLVYDSPAGGLVILEKLAREADKDVGADALAEALRDRLPVFGGPPKPHADWNTVAGTVGAIFRRAKRYGAELPFPSRQDAQGRWVHSMPADFAEMVLPHIEAILRKRGRL